MQFLDGPSREYALQCIGDGKACDHESIAVYTAAALKVQQLEARADDNPPDTTPADPEQSEEDRYKTLLARTMEIKGKRLEVTND
jgi:hypothetical protein